MWPKRAMASLLLLALPVAAQTRVVSLSPDVTEWLVALHAQDLLVGRDALARGRDVARVPVIGSSRALTAAPVLAARPDLVLGSSLAQPASIFDQLTRLGVRVIAVPHADDPAAFASGMQQIGRAVGKDEEGRRLAAAWLRGMQPHAASGRRVLLSYDGRLVAGSGTAGDALIRAAGAVNAAAALKGLLPMAPEAWVRAAPEVVIVAAHNLAALGGLAAFKARPELSASPAVRQGRVYAWPAADFLRLGVQSPAVAERLRRVLP